MVKNLPAMQEMQNQSLGLEDPLKKGTATYFEVAFLGGVCVCVCVCIF